MKFGTVTRFGVCSVVFLASACTSYYRITDQATGKTYYTTQFDRTDSGAVKFEDANSRSTVTLQSSEIIETSRAEFEARRDDKPKQR
jgi:hypothetical protein